MSHMNLYIKKEGVLKRATVNDFVPKGLLLRNLNEEELQTIFKRAVKEDIIEPYDLGLFYIDIDRKSIVSAQSEFTLQELEKAVGKKLTKGWKYVELEAAAATPDVISKLLTSQFFLVKKVLAAPMMNSVARASATDTLTAAPAATGNRNGTIGSTPPTTEARPITVPTTTRLENL